MDSQLEDTGLRLIDVNGDRLADLVRSESGNRFTYINNGSSGWTYDPNWSPILPFLNASADSGVRLGDINGDGLVDMICHNDNSSGGTCPSSSSVIYLNNGSGWTYVGNSWSFPPMANLPQKTESFLDSQLADTGLRLIDVNGDGLADLVRSESGNRFTYINNGSGWTYDANWSPTLPFLNASADSGVRLGDINGDGLVDLICHNDNSSGGTCPQAAPAIYLNNGVGWTNVTSTWSFPPIANLPQKTESFLDSQFEDNGLRLFDVNGDGIDDLVRGYEGSRFSYLNNGNVQSNLLVQIRSALGANTTVTYQATPFFRDTSGNLLNPKMSTVFYVVSKINNNDGLGTTETSDYEYSGGEYYFRSHLDRRFAGFGRVSKTTTTGDSSTTFYHQGNSTDDSSGEFEDHPSKIGKPFRVEQRDKTGNLYSLTIRKWELSSISDGSYFVKLAQTVTQNYDGNPSHKDKAVSFIYDDSYGNKIEEIQWGEVSVNSDGTFTDVGKDKVVVTTSYTSNLSAYIVGLPIQEIITNYAGEKVAETRMYYDELGLGLVTLGNQTKGERWKEAGNYIVTFRRQYDGNGLPIKEWDGRGNVTNFYYDEFNLYPTSIINALSHSTQLTYDYTSGQVKRRVDANGGVFEIVYDGFDRVLEEKQPSPSSPAVLVTKTEFVYTDTPNAMSIKQTNRLDEKLAVESYTYFDGYGRVLQERKQAETQDQFIARDYRYDVRGLMEKESLPYFSDGAERTSATTNNALYTSYTYDALSRVHTISTNIEVTTNSYDDWKTTITDALGKRRVLSNDAFDRLAQVEEKNDAESYVTCYSYNAIGNLTKITDALGYIRNFSYDGLGRRRLAEDLHHPSDATFGSWQYAFDDADNLSTRTDPKGQTLSFEYDELNRQTTEDFLGQPGIEVSYTYDHCSNGIGRFCRESSAAVTKTYEYDVLGQIASETATILGASYETDSDFDRQGNLTLLTNPDNSKIKYDYNRAGLIEKIWHMEGSKHEFEPIILNFDYNPVQNITEQVYASGTRTVNSYDANELYRLKQKLTTLGNGGQNVQDMNYTFDAVGNIKYIADNCHLNTRKMLNYNYDDLHRLIFASARKSTGGRMYTQWFAYDALGNFTLRSDQGTYSYAGYQDRNYANPHAVIAISNAFGTIRLSYDRNGNLESYGTVSHSWDYNNRLINTLVGGRVVSSTYTPDGLRVSYSSNLVTIVSPTRFFNTNGIVREKHVFAGNVVVATLSSTSQGTEVLYNHTDHLSGANILSDSNNRIRENTEYFPYGTIRVNTGTYFERRKFAGHEYDGETGLNYMKARYFDGTKGSFLSIDPVFLAITANISDPQALNAYSYARNNPLRYVDADGKSFFEAFAHNLYNGGAENRMKVGLAYLANNNGFNRFGAAAGNLYKRVPFALVGITRGVDILSIWQQPDISGTERAAKTAYKIHDVALGVIVARGIGPIGSAAVSAGFDETFEGRFGELKNTVDPVGKILYEFLPKNEDWDATVKRNLELQEQAQQRETESKLTLTKSITQQTKHPAIQGSQQRNLQGSSPYLQGSSPFFQGSSICLQGC